jgi:hypothetical protein
MAKEVLVLFKRPVQTRGRNFQGITKGDKVLYLQLIPDLSTDGSAIVQGDPTAFVYEQTKHPSPALPQQLQIRQFHFFFLEQSFGQRFDFIEGLFR